LSSIRSRVVGPSCQACPDRPTPHRPIVQKSSHLRILLFPGVWRCRVGRGSRSRVEVSRKARPIRKGGRPRIRNFRKGHGFRYGLDVFGFAPIPFPGLLTFPVLERWPMPSGLPASVHLVRPAWIGPPPPAHNSKKFASLHLSFSRGLSMPGGSRIQVEGRLV